MDQLHFLQPLWLLALIPLAILWWVIVRSKMSNSKAWENVIDPNLLPLLLSRSDEKHSGSGNLTKWLLPLAWLIATVALADPVWEKIPRPIFQTNSARVIVLDLSNSMQIADLKPSRIARARFKIEDILSGSPNNNSTKEEGQIGLVLFAGDAFTASPLTRDSETIRSLLQVLTPDIMPSQGSRVDLGLQKAHELLTQAGVNKGQVLLISDGVSDQDAALKMARELKNDGHTLSVLAVGTEIGGELPQIKYKNGESIIVALDSEFLQEIASSGGGKYHLISTNNSDLKSVLTSSTINDANKPKEEDKYLKSEDWKSSGPYLILFLLPLVALAFRRGWLFSVFLVASLIGILQPQPVLASPLTESLSNRWVNLWINNEQQADKALKEQRYDTATTLSKKPLMRGSAHYKNENYKKALKDFKQAKGANARYNEGNTLAKLEQFEEAINAYDKALKLQPDMEDAIKNKATIEQLLKNKKKQEASNDDKQNSDSKKSKDSDSKKESKESTDSQNKNTTKNDDNNGKKNSEEYKENSEQSKNQFSDANKDLDKPKNKDNKSQQEEESEKSKDKPAKEKPSEKEENGERDSKKNGKKSKDKGTNAKAEELNKEEKMAAEQWLRRIPDDPGGLLRRKFEAQYKQRRRSINDTKQPW